MQRHVGVGVHGNPLVGVHGSAVVHVGAHVDLLDAHLGEPEAPAAGQLSAPAPGRGLLVAAPVQQVVRVLGDVQKKVADVAFAHRVAAPDVLGAPVPPFPAVGVARLEREAAQDGHEAHLAAVRGMDGLRLAVAVTLAEHGVVAVFLLDAAQLLRDDVGGLVPRDALELALAAVARVALAIRVPVHALQGIQDAVVGIGALLVGERERRDVVFQQPFQLLAAHFQRPGPKLFGAVGAVEVHAARAHDAPVLDVDLGRKGAHAEAAQAERLAIGLDALHACLLVTWELRLPLCRRGGGFLSVQRYEAAARTVVQQYEPCEMPGQSAHVHPRKDGGRPASAGFSRAAATSRARDGRRRARTASAQGMPAPAGFRRPSRRSPPDRSAPGASAPPSSGRCCRCGS